MKKFALLFTVAIFASISAIAQTPQAFMYQAVVRDNAGEILASTTVSLRMGIREDSINGTIIYRETHLATSNQFGLVNIEIGIGVADIGTFLSINWGDGSRYLETELDPEAGINYVSMGITQLLSVPFALYSENTANKDDADADPANELNTSVNLNGTALEVGDAGGTLTTDLGSLVDDADADPANEIQTISKVDNLVTLSNSGGSFLDAVIDADHNPVNEFQTLSSVGNSLTISDGNTITIPGDNLGNHTAIQNINLNGNWLTNGGGDEGIFVRDDGKVGIGTGSPTEKLHVNGKAKISEGVSVSQSSEDGIFVLRAGMPLIQQPSPQKNGFEVAGAEGNGLFVGRANINGIRVLSAGNDGVHIDSAVVNGVHVSAANADGVYVHHAGNPSASNISLDNNGFEVAGAEGNGLYVGQAEKNGVYVDYASSAGVFVRSIGDPSTHIPSMLKNGFEVTGAEGNGLFVGRANINGIRVLSAGNDGVHIDSAVVNGVHISAANADGVYVHHAGIPSASNISLDNNGFEVAGTEGSGLYVGQADKHGVFVQSAAEQGMRIASSQMDGIRINSTGTDGIFVNSAGEDGIHVNSAVNRGFQVNSAGSDGVYVHHAGNPSSQTSSSDINGFEVAGAEGDGLYVGRADDDGAYINSAGENGVYIKDTGGDGVYVENAGFRGVVIESTGYDGVHIVSSGSMGFFVNSAGYHGLSVGEAGGDGVFVGEAGACGLNVIDCEDGVYINDAADDGVYVSYADDYAFYGNTRAPSREWGLFTPDNVYAYNIQTKGISTYAKNAGKSALEQGDIVCIAGGLEENVLDGEGFPVVNIHKAIQTNSQAVFGIVEYKVSIREESEEAPDGESQKVRKSFKQSDGNIEPGEYLSVVVFGQAEVKISDAKNIRAGQKLTVSEISGKARTLNNLDNWADTGILGKALEDSDGKGSIKVYVNCR